MRGDTTGITVLLLGVDARADVTKLRDHRATIVSPLPDPAALHQQRVEVNRLIDAAPSDWIVMLCDGEAVSERLAAELHASCGESPRAWGFRIATRVVFGRSHLSWLDDRVGAIRLFHRRHARFVENPGSREMKVQGSVVRVSEPIVVSARQSSGEGLSRRNAVSRTLRFATSVVRHAAAFRGSDALRYLWAESSWTQGDR